MVQLLWKRVWSFPQKESLELPYDPAILFLGIWPQRMENKCTNKNLYMNMYSSTVHHSWKVETTQVFVNGWMEKQRGVHPHSGILCSHEKEWSSDTGYHVDGPWTHDTQWEKPDTKTDTVCDSIVRKRPEQANPQTESGCQGLGEGVGSDF